MSIQPANKAVKHLINSFIWLVLKKKTQVNAYLKKNSKGGGGGESLSHKQSEELGGVLWVYKVVSNDQSLQWERERELALEHFILQGL